jgi:thiamine-phosphate pyrophosphorylase
MDTSTARILDANFNRAREALRVMEDYARFVLNDAELCQELKVLRHDLGNVVQPLAASGAIVARDTPQDVGTRIAAEGEYDRAAGGDVVRAAGMRLSEALRVLEEYGKTEVSELGARIETLRYRGYDIEKRLAHVISARQRFGDVRLYVLVTESLCKRPWREVVEAAARGGATCFQLREKELPDRQLLDRACEFCELCHDLGTLCIINDRADVAVASGADGVHLGQRDLGVAAARKVVGVERIVGASTHSVAEAETAIAECPDYVAVGPMFATAVKPEYGVSGPALIGEVRKLTALPLVAIGGIEPGNVGTIVEAGGTAVAVCTAIIGADDVERAVKAIIQALPETC